MAYTDRAIDIWIRQKEFGLSLHWLQKVIVVSCNYLNFLLIQNLDFSVSSKESVFCTLYLFLIIMLLHFLSRKFAIARMMHKWCVVAFSSKILAFKSNTMPRGNYTILIFKHKIRQTTGLLGPYHIQYDLQKEKKPV